MSRGKTSPPPPMDGRLFGLLQPTVDWFEGCRLAVSLLEHDQARCRLCLHLVPCCDGGSMPSVSEAAQAEVLASEKLPTMILFETRGL
jgi:hypothetical protein